MSNKLDVVDVLNQLGEPYTFTRKWRRLPWWIADRIGHTYVICYDGQPIRELTASYANTKDLVNLLNRVYQTGVADCMGIKQAV